MSSITAVPSQNWLIFIQRCRCLLGGTNVRLLCRQVYALPPVSASILSGCLLLALKQHGSFDDSALSLALQPAA